MPAARAAAGVRASLYSGMRTWSGLGLGVGLGLGLGFGLALTLTLTLNLILTLTLQRTSTFSPRLSLMLRVRVWKRGLRLITASGREAERAISPGEGEGLG